MAVLELKNINKIYNEGKSNQVHALKDINLSLSTNEIVAIVGVSGSGKSTLLNIIGQMDSATSGQYVYAGEKVPDSESGRAYFRNHILGYIPQDIGLLANETVLDNVSIPLLFNPQVKQKEIKSRVLNILQEVGMRDFLNRKIKTLSGGQKQRIAIARAIVNRPTLILADEPTGALDTKTAFEIMDVFRKLKSDSRTIVLVTHDPKIAAQCDRIVEIQDGRILGGES